MQGAIFLYSKQEILDKMKVARSWKELQIPIKEVYEAFSDDSYEAHDGGNAEVQELRSKIERLNETNRQLRSENKALRAGK